MLLVASIRKKHAVSVSDTTWFWIKTSEMEGRRDRPQQVLDFIDLIWKALYGEVLR